VSSRQQAQAALRKYKNRPRRRSRRSERWVTSGQRRELFAAIKARRRGRARLWMPIRRSRARGTEGGESRSCSRPTTGRRDRPDAARARAPIDLFEACAVGESARVEEWLDRDPDGSTRSRLDGFTAAHAGLLLRPEELRGASLRAARTWTSRRATAWRSTPIHAASRDVTRRSRTAARGGSESERRLARRAGVPSRRPPRTEISESLKDLLDHGRTPNPRSDDGKSGLVLARRRDRTEATALLRRAREVTSRSAT
jgi:hypothetical protein